MMRADQLRDLVIIPVLQELNMHSEAAVNLVLGTAAHESQLGTFIKQYPTGPALGIYQMEPATHGDIWDTYLASRPDLASTVRGLASQHRFTKSPSEELIGNMFYATAMCRLRYYRVSEPLPPADDIHALGLYWKRHYNTMQGAGTVEQFEHDYKTWVLGES